LRDSGRPALPVSGHVDPTGTMAEVNEALREIFACLTIRETGAQACSTAS
jgi:hypothetical protein